MRAHRKDERLHHIGHATPPLARLLGAISQFVPSAALLSYALRYALCSFLPVTLEQLARQQGVLWTDRGQSCVPNADELAKNGTASGSGSASGSDQCLVPIFGHDVTTASFAMYTFSIAVLVQVVVLVSFSSLADYGTYRKRLLLSFGMIGATTSILFLFIVPSLYLLASLLVIVGVACLGSSFAVLNSFLPLLVQNHPQVRDQNIAVDTAPSHNSADPSQSSKAMSLSTSISAKGVGIGYIAAVSVQIFSIGLLLLLTKVFHVSSQTLPLRLILFFVGIFWLTFSLPTYLYLRSRPGPSFPDLYAASDQPFTTYRNVANFAYRILYAWRALFGTIRLAVQLRQTRLCLAAWFLLSDAVATISGTAILFARTELKISTIGIAILSITATVSGIMGAFGWPRVQAHFRLRTNRTVVAMILMMELIPLYALAPYLLPFLQTWHVGGLQAWWEIYPLAVLHGLIMGGISTYCRSIFSQLIPPGMEAAFFAVFAVTDKGSSAIGPTVVGRIVDKTGSIRPAFGFIALVVLAPSPLMWLINTDRGRKDALALAQGSSVTTSDSSASLPLSGTSGLRERSHEAEVQGLLQHQQD